MLKDIKDLIAKKLKNKEIMSDRRKTAYADMTKTLTELANEGLKEDLMKKKGMQKVTVMAKDQEGLKEGLEKAEDILEQMPTTKTPEEMEEEREDEMEDSKEHEMAEEAMEMPLEEIDKKIEELMKMKEKQAQKVK